MTRNYCFTWNNPEIEIFNHKLITYIIWGKETGKNGTYHYQGYVELSRSTRLSTMKSQINDKIHWEIRKGTQQQAIDYCKKDGNWQEKGAPKEQGRRNDLDGVRQMAAEDGMKAVTAIYNYQAIRVAEKYLEYNEEGRDWKPFIYWLWGGTGVGKSRTAKELCNNDVYTKNNGNKWWNGYDNHECVIIDDFRSNWFEYTELLSLLDRYEKRIEVKGGMRQFRARMIVITSKYPPKGKQLRRRIDVVAQCVAGVEGNTECLNSEVACGLTINGEASPPSTSLCSHHKGA